MPDWFIELAKIGGPSMVVFFVFYLYHRSTAEQFSAIINQTFELLKEMIDQNSLQLSYLQKIDTKVTSNLWCPYVKQHSGYMGGGIDESTHHAA